MEPPPFQEAPRCDVCKCSFSTFKRRHHCRRCGRSLCAEHSSNQMALPQFGLHSSVRVCADCFNNFSGSKRDNSSDEVSSLTNQVSKFAISSDSDSKIEQSPEKLPTSGGVVCTCGMPLCICEAPPSPPRQAVIMQVKTTSTTTAVSSPRLKKVDSTPTPKNRGSSSNSKPGTVFNLGQVTNNNIDTSLKDYEVNGEGLRAAIKNGDTAGARKLLSQGVDANYCDKQGSSLLHLAAVFNQTEIAFALIDNGAKIDCKNSQGETPLDCAPAMLQYKMRTKIEETRKLDS